MSPNVIACQQFAQVGSSGQMSSSGEVWQLTAGLEGIVVLVLFIGWLHAAWGMAECRDEDREAPQ